MAAVLGDRSSPETRRSFSMTTRPIRVTDLEVREVSPLRLRGLAPSIAHARDVQAPDYFAPSTGELPITE
jgi:hypothetical protein